MKELTTEQKAAAYDRAIKIAKEINNEHQAQPFDVMTRVFPELKESEDEKIRNCLISYFKSQMEARRDDSQEVLCTYSKWIAWLEKQGEHANFRNKIQIGDKVTRNEDGVLVNLSQLNRVAKPADKVEPKFKVGDKIKLAKESTYPAREIIAIKNDAYYFDKLVHLPFCYQDEWELVEQKSTWNKEDEETALGIEQLCNCASLLNISPDKINKVKQWLKSIKERVQPQKQWKPSEEQMNALNDVISSRDIKYDVLSELWKDLKKLKEE